MMSLSERLKRKHLDLQSSVKSARERLEMKEQYVVKLSRIKTLKDEITLQIELYKKARYVTNKIQSNKGEQDELSIRNSLEVACSLVLKGNDAVPYFETTDGAYPETRLVIDLDERTLELSEAEGTGFNESVSMVTTTSVLASTHYTKFLFFDEKFSSVSPDNTENLSTSLNNMFDGKFQVVLIEQKGEIVKHTAHREFFISYENGVSTVTTYDVDEEGNKTLVEV